MFFPVHLKIQQSFFYKSLPTTLLQHQLKELFFLTKSEMQPAVITGLHNFHSEPH
jgi:hypothetical protein